LLAPLFFVFFTFQSLENKLTNFIGVFIYNYAPFIPFFQCLIVYGRALARHYVVTCPSSKPWVIVEDGIPNNRAKLKRTGHGTV